MNSPSSHDDLDLHAMLADREAATLAPYAMHSAATAGRRHAEPPHPYRGPFQRDRDRIVHSAAYRRLAYKTQVFTGDMGDYHRTRLTHTLEVSSIARTLARALRLNEDLVEALAMAHDLGHPPFGHAGEEALNECMADDGGFCHNRHALRIVEQLERRYRDFPGLNLSVEVLEGQAARIKGEDSNVRRLLEVQVVDAADSVAYDAHDADDALKLGLLLIEELESVPLWREAAGRVGGRYTDTSVEELASLVVRELIDWQVGDLLRASRGRIAAGGVDSPQAVRRGATLIAPGDEVGELKKELEQFLYERVYRHPKILVVRRESQGELRHMFARLVECPELLPKTHRLRAEAGRRRAISDYLAGMTDRFARQEFRRLCGPHQAS